MEMPRNLGPVFHTSVSLRGGKTADLYVVAREEPEALAAREAVEELIAAVRYERKHSRRLSDLAGLLADLKLGDAARQRVAEILVGEELDEIDQGLFRGLLAELDECEGSR